MNVCNALKCWRDAWHVLWHSMFKRVDSRRQHIFRPPSTTHWGERGWVIWRLSIRPAIQHNTGLGRLNPQGAARHPYIYIYGNGLPAAAKFIVIFIHCLLANLKCCALHRSAKASAGGEWVFLFGSILPVSIMLSLYGGGERKGALSLAHIWFSKKNPLVETIIKSLRIAYTIKHRSSHKQSHTKTQHTPLDSIMMGFAHSLYTWSFFCFPN